MLVAIEQKDLVTLFETLERIQRSVEKREREDVFDTVLTHEDAARYLKMSERYLHDLKGVEVPYSSYGKKLLYQKKDLDAFLTRNRVECTKK